MDEWREAGMGESSGEGEVKRGTKEGMQGETAKVKSHLKSHKKI